MGRAAFEFVHIKRNLGCNNAAYLLKFAINRNRVELTFFVGILISFTIAMILLSAVMVIAMDDAVVPVSLILQSFLLSVVCSLINLVYRSEKLKFIWQSIIGYVLTTGTIIIFGLIFGWYSYGGNGFGKTKAILISFLVYSLFYLVTWIIIWKVTKLKRKELNEKLEEYKLRQ